MTAFERAAQAAADAFESVSRGAGESYVRLKAERPEWVRMALFECMPAYGDSTEQLSELSRDAIGFIIDSGFDYAREAEHRSVDFGNSVSDDHYVDLAAWLGSNPVENGGWCTRAIDDYGMDTASGGLWNIVQVGQTMQACSVYSRWVDAIDKASSEFEESDGDEDDEE